MIYRIIRLFRPYLKKEGLKSDDLRRFLLLRQEFFEIDSRFSEIGESGTFDALDAAGALRHRVVDPGSIERAMIEPPPGTRARVRGDYIRNTWSERGGKSCSWDAIWDIPNKQVMDLSDPFETVERWEAAKARRVVQRGNASEARITCDDDEDVLDGLLGS